MSTLLRVTLISCALLVACGPEPTGISVERTQSPIVGGTVAPGPGSTVFLRATSGASTGHCSGVVVSPHVVLTAGHCSSSTGFDWAVFTGDDFQAQGGDPTTLVPVRELKTHPNYDAKNGVFDIGVMITREPIGRPAATLNRRVLGPGHVGTPVHIAGFGQTSATDKAIGVRREAFTTLSNVYVLDVAIQGAPNICLYDSGGPLFLAPDGGPEVLAGITYLTSSANCDARSYFWRVDQSLSFLDEVLADAEPDAGPPDAGPIDAGPWDAGTWEPDAGVPPADAGHLEPGCAPDAGAAEPAMPRGCSAAPGLSTLGLAIGFLRRRRAQPS